VLLAANLAAVRCVSLLIDAATGVLADLLVLPMRLPGDHPPASVEGRDPRVALARRLVGVDVRLAADRIAVRVVALKVDAHVGASILARRLPGDDPAAIVEQRDLLAALVACGERIDPSFSTRDQCHLCSPERQVRLTVLVGREAKCTYRKR